KPAVCLWHRESPEINGLLEANIQALEPGVLLRPDVHLDFALPRLARLQSRERRAKRDLRELLRLVSRVCGVRALALVELPAGTLGNQRGDIPLALEGDPPRLCSLLGDLVQVLAEHRSAVQADDPDGVLALEPLW